MSINLKAGILGILRRSRREINQANQEQGRSGEAQVKARYEMNGWAVTRTGKGHDYRVTRKNWTTGKTETKYVGLKYPLTINAEVIEIKPVIIPRVCPYFNDIKTVGNVQSSNPI